MVVEFLPKDVPKGSCDSNQEAPEMYRYCALDQTQGGRVSWSLLAVEVTAGPGLAGVTRVGVGTMLKAEEEEYAEEGPRNQGAR